MNPNLEWALAISSTNSPEVLVAKIASAGAWASTSLIILFKGKEIKKDGIGKKSQIIEFQIEKIPFSPDPMF